MLVTRERCKNVRLKVCTACEDPEPDTLYLALIFAFNLILSTASEYRLKCYNLFLNEPLTLTVRCCRVVNVDDSGAYNQSHYVSINLADILVIVKHV